MGGSVYQSTQKGKWTGGFLGSLGAHWGAQNNADPPLHGSEYVVLILKDFLSDEGDTLLHPECH